MENDVLMVLTACSVAIPASLLGVLLVSKSLVMVGDAISHAVLPGIVVAYLLSGTRDSGPMLLGAAVTGFLTTFLIDFLKRKWQIQEDAAIGFTFTFLFATGVLLIALFAGKNSDLDQECVLYGDLETSILDQVVVGGYLYGTRAILQLLPLTIVLLLVIVFGFKGWKIWVFNPDFGSFIGIPVRLFHLTLMLLLSIHAVLSFESVGVILVVGLLVLPAATALQFSKTLSRTFYYSACIGIISCILGVLIGKWINISISPLIVCVNGLIFLVSVILSPFRRKTGQEQNAANPGFQEYKN
ncbi:metal ABC transporter permease [Fluviicola sp.]|jgi:manganese/zinc/iron transport system permease protein|uniref:metal ABC transporter permease n=1 Tax=Fluviicola sp. TaxID=1917219 RepID=UPI00281C710F|nr:metal ABC transporter permease [Fluviicola sp.]MDR0802159.1 metal ABC transporter permease [Fluviicola sp.]